MAAAEVAADFQLVSFCPARIFSRSRSASRACFRDLRLIFPLGLGSAIVVRHAVTMVGETRYFRMDEGISHGSQVPSAREQVRAV
jgi:hypothetical protein